MRLHIAILLLVLSIANILQDSDCDSSVQNVDESTVTSSQPWERGSEAEVFREDFDGEPEPPKRVRSRNGKRRRRLRQRPRTTERPQDIDDTEEINTAATSLEGTENGETPPTRRRPTNSKRRRRPMRRYHSDPDQPPPRARRRKGGRKRIRPPVTLIEDFETTTFFPVDYNYSSPIRITLNDVAKTERITTDFEHSYTSDTQNLKYTEMGNSHFRTHEVHSNHSVAKATSDVPEESINDNKEVNELTVSQQKPIYEEKLNLNENNQANEFGNKIFDRKTLFSSSRKLPETSATLRRRLTPRLRGSLKNSTYANHVRIIKPLANLESEIEDKDKFKNEVIPQETMIDSNTRQPEISENQVLNKLNSKMTQELAEEEPNYPKLESFVRKDKTILIEDKEQITTQTEIPITTTMAIIVETTIMPQNESQEVKSSDEIRSRENNNPTLKLPNFDDEVFELLKSEAGSRRLQRILHLRNMTLSQLLDHRERGSSKFHLSDIFSKSQPHTKEFNKPIKEDNNTSKVPLVDTEKPRKTNNLILLPTYGNKNTKIEIEISPENNRKSTTLKPQIPNHHRESRIFDSLPEFSSTKATIPEIRPYPTWRIIPNPKLKPVSIRGDYKEIKISNVITTHKPYTDNDINKIFLLDERENFINRNKMAATISSDNRENTFFFRKIPVSVKSAIVISGAILVLAIFGFLSVLVSCRLRQKKARLRAKQDILCEHLQNDDFMTSQQSLSPVLTKHHRGPVYSQGNYSNAASNRHYYLWRTLRKTFQYD